MDLADHVLRGNKVKRCLKDNWEKENMNWFTY